MAHCAPFEDYDYIIFGHDRGYIVLTDVFCLSLWIPCLLRIPPCGARLYFWSFTVPIIPLVPLRVAKTLHTLFDPLNVESSFIFCWYLRIEYFLHYWLSNIFLTSSTIFVALVLLRRSTVFPEDKTNKIMFLVASVEAILRGGIAEFLDSTLSYWPSTYHAWLQIIVTVLLQLMLLLFPCCACRKTKEGRGGWSTCWFSLYITIPMLLHYFQFFISSVILLPRHGVKGYEGNEEEQKMFWFSIESYISHKFAFTPMGIMAPLILLPPVRDVIRSVLKRKDAVRPA